MEALPSDILFSLAIHLDFPDLLRFCSSSSRINNILCNREPIWRYKLQQDFSNKLTNLLNFIKDMKFKRFETRIKIRRRSIQKKLTKLPASVHILQNLSVDHWYSVII